MTSDDADARADFAALLRVIGLTVPDSELEELATIHARATGKRQRLAAAELNEAEPATIFVPSREPEAGR